jgi:16S rRNA (uracil1498-N3)-methyltransferase
VAIARFYHDAPLVAGEEITLPQRVAHHATHVLRLRPGDPIAVFNGHGGEYQGRLLANARVLLLQYDPVEREPALQLTLLQSWIATDKLDWLVEKAVELGAAAILLAPARRSVVRLTDARRVKRVERLREIAIAACCQCGRNRIPVIESFGDLEPALLAGAARSQLAVWLQPTADRSLTALARAAAATATTVAVGPEGGFDDTETALALRCGYQPCRLGPRVLRTETAGVAALAALQAVAGDLT